MSNANTNPAANSTSSADTTASANNMETNKESSIDEFSQVGRTGRRNALHDIFDERCVKLTN